MDAIKQIATDSIKKISTNLLDPKRKTPLTEQEVESILKGHLTAAFKEAGSKKKKSLYNVLSLNFHPDKFQNLHPKLFAYLDALKMKNVPMTVINELNNTNVFNELLNNPVNGITSIYDYIQDKLNTFFLEHMRYIQPFQTISKVLGLCVFIPVFIATLALLVGILLIHVGVKLLDNLSVKLLNVITFNRYESEYTEYFDPAKIAELKKNYIDKIRQDDKERDNILETDTMNDEELYASLVNQDLIEELQRLAESDKTTIDLEAIKQKIEAEFIQEIINEHPVAGFEKIKLMLFAAYKSLIQPLPEDVTKNKWLSYLVIKPLQFGSLLINMAAVTVIEMIRYLNVALLILTIGTSTLTAVTVIAIINSPLYLKDLLVYTHQTSKSYSNSDEEENSDVSNKEANETNNSGPKSMLALGLPNNTFDGTLPTQPQNYGGVIHSGSQSKQAVDAGQRDAISGAPGM